MNLILLDKDIGSGICGKIVKIMQKALYYYIHINNNIKNIYIVMDNYYEEHKHMNNLKMNIIFSKCNEVKYEDKILVQEYLLTDNNKIPINIKNIVMDNNFKILKILFQKIRFNDIIYKNINETYKNMIGDNTLGVHIRLTDMNKNKKHIRKYGQKFYLDFKKKIQDIIKLYTINNIFVASDNDESITKLIKDFPNIKICYIKNLMRVEYEKINSYDFQINNFDKEQFYSDTITDCLMLSKCKYLIYRTSNVANIAISTSSTLKKYYMV